MRGCRGQCWESCSATLRSRCSWAPSSVWPSGSSFKPVPRLDVLVTRSGLAESRERAQALILAGKVRVAGETVRRPDRSVSEDAAISVEAGPDYASRGALKLAPALDSFGVDPAGRVCAG